MLVSLRPSVHPSEFFSPTVLDTPTVRQDQSVDWPACERTKVKPPRHCPAHFPQSNYPLERGHNSGRLIGRAGDANCRRRVVADEHQCKQLLAGRTLFDLQMCTCLVGHRRAPLVGWANSPTEPVGPLVAGQLCGRSMASLMLMSAFRPCGGNTRQNCLGRQKFSTGPQSSPRAAGRHSS